MFPSPMKNLNDFFKTRPPLVVFLFCLILMAFTTFSLAFYVAHNEKFLNTDALDDWNGMMEYFNKLSVCMNDCDGVDVADEQIKQYTTSVTIEVTLKNINKYANLSGLAVQGLLNLEGWQPKCQKLSQKPNNLKVAFIIPSNNTNKICLTITGPEMYLPKLSKTHCTAAATTTNIHNSVNMNLCTGTVSNESFQCQHGFKMKFHFDQLEENEFSIFLSQNDKTVIYIHLMWCSYVLVLFIIIVLLYAIFYKKQENAEHLSYLIS